ncbi:MAG: hypothetical protein ACOY0T_32205 [Myxococcota bacterium]
MRRHLPRRIAPFTTWAVISVIIVRWASKKYFGVELGAAHVGLAAAIGSMVGTVCEAAAKFAFLHFRIAWLRGLLFVGVIKHDEYRNARDRLAKRIVTALVSDDDENEEKPPPPPPPPPLGPTGSDRPSRSSGVVASEKSRGPRRAAR